MSAPTLSPTAFAQAKELKRKITVLDSLIARQADTKTDCFSFNSHWGAEKEEFLNTLQAETLGNANHSLAIALATNKADLTTQLAAFVA